MKWFVYYFVCLSFWSSQATDTVVIRINDGQIKGVVNKTVELGAKYYAFRAIPFAKPPVGDLRFEPPVPVDKWDDVLDATKDGSFCTQGSSPVVGSEDCLFVNVYTPQLPKESDAGLTVMVWIYGGAFELGRCTYEDYGPDYFLDKGVVVVTFNYRIGLFGFLSTGDSVVPGNNGLKDQVLALKWVNNNIRYFGGDPKKITIFGGSAGSASTSYLMQSPKSKGLFSKAIMQSGVSLSLWALSRTSKQAAFQLGSKLGLNTTNSQELIKFLRTFNTTHLQAQSQEIVGGILTKDNPRDGLVFAPVIEPFSKDAFFSSKSHELLSEGDFQDVPCIIGFNSLEATFDVGGLIRLFLWKYDSNPNLLVPIDMNINNVIEAKEIGLQIKNQYFGSLPLILSKNLNIMEYISDDMFVRPIREFVRIISRKSKVYYYRFDYQGGLSGWVNRTADGAGHSEEVSYMWRSYFPPTSNDDLVTRSRMVTMWTNFAKYGNPTPSVDSLFQNKLWQTADSLGENNLVYLNIGKNLSLELNPQNSNMLFWDKTYKTYATPPLDTY